MLVSDLYYDVYKAIIARLSLFTAPQLRASSNHANPNQELAAPASEVSTPYGFTDIHLVSYTLIYDSS